MQVQTPDGGLGGAFAGAVLGMASAFLHALLGVGPWVVTLTAILVLQWLRLPVITERGGAWRWAPWLVWLLTLAVCPMSAFGLGIVYEHRGLKVLGEPVPVAWDIAFWLGFAQVPIAILASIAVVIITRRLIYRWLAWALCLLSIPTTMNIAIGAARAIRGE